jgi:pilus assembly protein Flp/PilA
MLNCKNRSDPFRGSGSVSFAYFSQHIKEIAVSNRYLKIITNHFYYRDKENVMRTMINRLFRDEDGATAVEYGLLVALIAVVILAAVGTLGTNLNTKFTSVSTRVGS